MHMYEKKNQNCWERKIWKTFSHHPVFGIDFKTFSLAENIAVVYLMRVQKMFLLFCGFSAAVYLTLHFIGAWKLFESDVTSYTNIVSKDFWLSSSREKAINKFISIWEKIMTNFLTMRRWRIFLQHKIK